MRVRDLLVACSSIASIPFKFPLNESRLTVTWPMMDVV